MWLHEVTLGTHQVARQRFQLEPLNEGAGTGIRHSRGEEMSTVFYPLEAFDHVPQGSHERRD